METGFDAKYLAGKIESCARHCGAVRTAKIAGAGSKTSAKNTLRKLSSFYVDPALDAQAQWNEQAVAALSQMAAYMREQQDYVSCLEQSIADLQRRVGELEQGGEMGR